MLSTIRPLFLFVCLISQTGYSRQIEPTVTPTAHQETPSAGDQKTAAKDDKNGSPGIKPFTDDELEQLLATRLKGGMGDSFGQFANMFLVSSRIQMGTGIGLTTSNKSLASLPLQSPFPESYKPTLREFLDSIALQTFSEWKYDSTNKYLKDEGKKDALIERLAIFEFSKTKRAVPYAIELAGKWKAFNKGNWVMHVPPSFPVGMDIYQMGTYSSDDKLSEPDFANAIRSAVALDWAQRVNEKATVNDFTRAKVGKYDALFYESMIPSQLNKDLKWRQWVFMADNRCFFIVSTILPEFEDKIYPDVEKMVASFRMKTQTPPENDGSQNGNSKAQQAK